MFSALGRRFRGRHGRCFIRNAPGFDGKVAALKGAIEHHVEEEEDELFPTAKKLMTAEALVALAQMMEAEANRMMMAGAPRRTIQVKAEEPRVQA
ncbi:MAG: hypothetical protein ACXVDD_23395 [Polyangia bacterium]